MIMFIWHRDVFSFQPPIVTPLPERDGIRNLMKKTFVPGHPPWCHESL